MDQVIVSPPPRKGSVLGMIAEIYLISESKKMITRLQLIVNLQGDEFYNPEASGSMPFRHWSWLNAVSFSVLQFAVHK